MSQFFDSAHTLLGTGNELEEIKGVELKERKARRKLFKYWEKRGEGTRSRNTDKFLNPYNVRQHILGKTDKLRMMHLAYNKKLM